MDLSKIRCAPIIDCGLFSTNSEISTLRGLKYVQRKTLGGKPGLKLQFRRDHLKLCRILTVNTGYHHIHHISALMLKQSQVFPKCIVKLNVFFHEAIVPSLTRFSNIKEVFIDIDIRRVNMLLNNREKYRLLKNAMASRKIEVLHLNPFLWENVNRITHYSNIKYLELKSSITEFFENSSEPKFNAYCQKAGKKGIEYSLCLFLDQNNKFTCPTSHIALLTHLQALTIKTNGCIVPEIPIISDSAEHLTNLKFLSYNENGVCALRRPESLGCISKLSNLEKLELELFMNHESKSTMFEYLVLPKKLKHFKLIFSNCKFGVIEQASANYPFFMSLTEIHGLESLEFEAFRLSPMKDTQTSCMNFVKTLLRSLNCKLKVLKLKGPPTKEVDDEFYQLILEHESLECLDIGLTTKATDDMISKIGHSQIRLRSLLMYNNPLFFNALPENCLAGIQELCLYIGVHTPMSENSVSYQEKFLGILRKVKLLPQITELTIYYSLSPDKIRDRLIKEIPEITSSLKRLRVFSLVMRGLKLTHEEKEALATCYKWNKFLESVSLKFFNVEFGRDPI